MMVALLLFAYSTKERSSRGIERHCRQDIAYRVITANLVPDHATIARFCRATRTRWRSCSARCSGCAQGRRGYLQGYNAQAVVNESQVVLAAEITVDAGDFSHLRPMIAATCRELEHAGVSDTPQVAVADAGYWNEQHMDDVTAQGIAVLIPPDSSKRVLRSFWG